VVALSKLGRASTENPVLGADAARQCLRMGRDLESESAFFIEELVAYSIQLRNLEELGDPQLASEKRRFEQRKRFIKEATAFSQSEPVQRLPESRWVAYLEVMLEHGEEKAVRRMEKELNRSFPE